MIEGEDDRDDDENDEDDGNCGGRPVTWDALAYHLVPTGFGSVAAGRTRLEVVSLLRHRLHQTQDAAPLAGVPVLAYPLQRPVLPF